MMCSQIPCIRNLQGTLQAQALNLVQNGAMIKSVPGPLSSQGGLADGPLNSGSGQGERLVGGGGGDLACTEENEGAALVEGGCPIGEEREVWLRARWAEEGGGRRRGRETVEVSEGGAFGAGQETVGRGVGHRVVKELEAGRAEGRGVEEEDAGGADAAAHAANPETVEETAVLGAAVAAFGIGSGVWRRRSGVSRRKVHDHGDWFGNDGFRVLEGSGWKGMPEKENEKRPKVISFYISITWAMFSVTEPSFLLLYFDSYP